MSVWMCTLQVLPAIPPNEAFQRPATSDGRKPPSTAASTVSVGMRTRNAQGDQPSHSQTPSVSRARLARGW